MILNKQRITISQMRLFFEKAHTMFVQYFLSSTYHTLTYQAFVHSLLIFVEVAGVQKLIMAIK